MGSETSPHAPWLYFRISDYTSGVDGIYVLRRDARRISGDRRGRSQSASYYFVL